MIKDTKWQAEAERLRLEGYTFREISDRIGGSVTTVHKAVRNITPRVEVKAKKPSRAGPYYNGPDMLNEIYKLLDKGHSFREIGEKVGKTKAAIAGIAYRRRQKQIKSPAA